LKTHIETLVPRLNLETEVETQPSPTQNEKIEALPDYGISGITVGDANADSC
jgi:hypothetical protein